MTTLPANPPVNTSPFPRLLWEGMMWFDNDPKTTLEEKISVAAKYYRKKHGQAPEVVYLNASQFEPVKIEGLTVKPSGGVLPHHIWIGMKEKE